MPESAWVFGCKLTLSQGDCQEYEKDIHSRGAPVLKGCPSCVHRQPSGVETMRAEREFAERARRGVAL